MRHKRIGVDMGSKSAEKAAVSPLDTAPRGVDVPAVPEEMFEGVGCVLTLREPWHYSGNRMIRVAHSAAQVRYRLQRGAWAKFDRLGDYRSGEVMSPTLWEGWIVSHEIHVRSAEVMLIDERVFGAALGVNPRFDMDLADSLLMAKSGSRWKFWR